MSKRDFKKYIATLTKAQLEAQFVEMYDKFKEVKTYYDFVFNPNEEKLIQEAKIKISNEYFPVKTKRAKLRRSVSQKFIKHFIHLGVDAFAIAEIMIYAIDIAQVYTKDKAVHNEAFYKSMYNSYTQATTFMIEKGIIYNFIPNLERIAKEAKSQKWPYHHEYQLLLERLDY